MVMNLKGLQKLLTAFGDFKRSQIIEVRTDRNENFVFHQQIVEKLKKFLSK
jgi:2-succinyl-5-enolpyruvyl-6-hydroxy-3-cyclohexene-1-carboxylate synthase